MYADTAWRKRPRDKIPVGWSVNVTSWADLARVGVDPLQVEITLSRKDKKQASYFRIVLAAREAYEILDVLTHRGIKP